MVNAATYHHTALRSVEQVLYLVFSTSRKARGLGSSFCDIWSSESFISNRATDRVPMAVEEASGRGGDGYRNMNPKLVYTREKKQYELKIGNLVLIGIRLHTSLEA